jgi:quercetin dioxygenase-like cupin family protein
MIVPVGGTDMNVMNGKAQPTSHFVAALLVIGAAVGALTLNARLSFGQPGTQPGASAQGSPAKNHAGRFSHALPQMDGSHLRAIVVEVNYGPGESDKPHSHPCVVIGHVAQGAIRFQVKGEPETVYKAGESFYEAPNGVHQVSANASDKEPAKLIAYFVCDHDTPLTVPPIDEHAGHDAR